MRVVRAGSDAKVVMAGVGSTARQAWPPVKPASVSVSFATAAEFAKVSVQKFDSRTDASSVKNASIISASRLTPVPNLAPSYEYRLLDQIFDGASMAVETTVAGAPKTLALPSMIIVSAKVAADDDIVGVEYGSNGLRIVSMLGQTVRYEKTIPYLISAGTIIRVERFLSWIQIYVNGIRIASETHPSFDSVGSPGIGLFSTVSPNTSTPIGATTFSGSSSIVRNVNGRFDFPTIKLVQSTIQVLGETYITNAGFFRGSLNLARWTNPTAFSTRAFYIYLNDVRIGSTGDQNGTDLLTTARFSVPANSKLDVRAYSNAGENDRTIKSGFFLYWAVP